MPHGRSGGGPDASPSLAITLMQRDPSGPYAPPQMTGFYDGQLPDEEGMGSPESGEEEREHMRLEALGGRQKDRAEALIEIKEGRGKWSKAECGYEPRSMRGQQCGGCVFYHGTGEGVGSCHLVEGQVEEDAVCNRHVEHPGNGQ